MFPIRVPLAPSSTAPTITFSSNSIGVDDPRQPTMSATGKALVISGCGLAALGLIFLGVSAIK